MVFPVFRFFTMVLCGKQWKILVYIILNFWHQRKTGKIFTEMDIFPRCLIVKTRQPWYSIFMRKRKESQEPGAGGRYILQRFSCFPYFSDSFFAMTCRTASTIAAAGEKVKGNGGNSGSTVGKVLAAQGIAGCAGNRR